MSLFNCNLTSMYKEYMADNWKIVIVCSLILNVIYLIVGLGTVPAQVYSVTGVAINMRDSFFINLGFVPSRHFGFLIYTIIVCACVSMRYVKEIKRLKGELNND